MGKWVLVVLVAAMAFFQWYSGRTARAFATAAEEMKLRVPFVAAPGVRIDKAELKGKELLLNVTLTDEQPDASRFQQQQTIYLLKKTMTAGWCGHKAIRRGIDEGFVMSAVANRVDGSELTRISVSHEECVCAEQGGDVCVIR
jgi:hypothetical protein